MDVDNTDALRQLELTRAQRTALEAAVEHDQPVLPGRTRNSLWGLACVDQDGNVTDLGRRQVRWYNDDVALLWDVEPDTINSYVDTTSIPPEDGRAIVGRHVRRYWKPSTILTFKRPGMGGPTGPRVQFDVQRLVRQYRTGQFSIRALAREHGVSASTVTDRLRAARVLDEKRVEETSS
jgi:hypothetical protein